MQMSDQREIKADPATVYAALLDPEVLKACVPGTQELTGSPEEGYEAVVVQKVGPVKATFKGQVTMTDMVPNEKLTISGEGKGGAAGFAKGGAVVTLEPTEAGTLLSYDVEAKVGGKLAQLGGRLIDGFAKKMADNFFQALQDKLEGPADTAE
ncbi:CoxG family protein [Chachezhania antarctica]|uniref:CoxG family protein n=1 Tax=Chachezhania antarctica TaxID=2340860 RepID=UPI000EABC949|nr:carbon monoxide dehydrogenase subunit G [Chachezhania antarctica]|tara:strand:+ start:1067 stop:1525 length:459 start_codon:yes stop_codon:yes gene_type:complete